LLRLLPKTYFKISTFQPNILCSSYFKAITQFLKSAIEILKNDSWSSIMYCIFFVYGETGTTPLSVDTEARLVSFWSSLMNPLNAKLSSSLYSIMLRYLINATNKNSYIFYGSNCKKCFHKMWSHTYLRFTLFPEQTIVVCLC